MSVSPSLSPLPPYFKRTNVSCSHCSTALVFCSQFSREPGGRSCFEQPQSNPTQGRQRESRKRLEELKELRNKRARERERQKQPCTAVQQWHRLLCCELSKQQHFRPEEHGIIFLFNSTGEKITKRKQLCRSKTVSLFLHQNLFWF